MSAIPDNALREPPRVETGGALGALLGFFVIAGAECQRLWPTGTSLIYLFICLPLLAIWIAHLRGWKAAHQAAGTAIDVSIYVLIVANLGAQVGMAVNPSGTLAATLLFWSPLIAAWWTWRYRSFPIALPITQTALLIASTWPFANDYQRLDKHAILALGLILLVHYLARIPPSREGIGQNPDPSTGFPSPEYFEAELAQVSAISDRYNFPMSLIGLRLSFPVEPRHADLLRRYAESISDRLRTADTACRWDTNTFIVILPNTTESQAEAVAHGLMIAGRAYASEARCETLAYIRITQRIRGEDPMSTLTTLENALSKPA